MRRTSVTIAATLFLGSSLAAVGPGAAVAQDDAVGADVAILDAEGVTRGTISVREFEDPSAVPIPRGRRRMACATWV